jgi:hypothetical protein
MSDLKLFLCEITLRVSRYMEDGEHVSDHTCLVWARDADAAERIITARPEFKTIEYSVYRDIIRFDATAAISEDEA